MVDVAGGKLLKFGITPSLHSVIADPGSIYKVTFEYICDSTTAIFGNVYLFDDKGDFPATRVALTPTTVYKKMTFTVTAGLFHEKYNAFIRLWSVDRVFPVRIKNVVIEVCGSNEKITRRYERLLKKEKDNKLQIKVRKSGQKNVQGYQKKIITDYNLKEAPLTVFSYVKDEGKYFLERLLKSTVPYVDEVIIIDTGSTDNTEELIKKYEKYGNLKFYQYPCKPDRLFESINKGLKHIKKGNWIFVMGGDEAILKEELLKLPPLLEELKETDVRVIKHSYLDFIGDTKHYHTLYPCVATKIWRNIKGFHFGGDYQGDIYMGYNDGIQTGGITTKRNLPKEYIKERLDIFTHHYARCKDKKKLLDKRIKYYEKRMPGKTAAEVLVAAKKCPFYTLQLPKSVYNGPQVDDETKPIIGFYTLKPGFSHFARPIIKELKKRGYDVHEVYDNPRKLYNKVDWLWVEWGDYWVENVLREKRKCKVIVRIHRYELEREVTKQVKWQNADILWFVNRDVMENFQKKFPRVNVPMVYLPNAVDVGSLEFNDRNEFGKKIVMYSVNFQAIKDYPEAISVLKLLSRQDKGFELTIRSGVTVGNVACEKCKELAKGHNIKFITTSVNTDKLADNDDINRLLRDKDILLSTSKYESFHYSIAEALAKGLQVFVRGWNRGGRPNDFWEPYVCETKEEMIKNILAWSKKSVKRKRRIAKRNRKYVEDNFGHKKITSNLISILGGNIVPHVVIVVPAYNSAKFIEKTMDSLVNQTYKYVTPVVINDSSTDKTLEVLKKFKNNIIVKTVKHGGAHKAMSEGLKVAKELGADYTVFFGSDDIAESNYVEEMFKVAEANRAWLVYPNFNRINTDGGYIDTHNACPPDLEKLRKETYICDHSLVSKEFWEYYGWQLHWKKFDAYSILHLWLTMMKHFPGNVRWVDKVLWNYRQRPGSLHATTKNKRHGQRAKVLKDIFGD